MKRNLKHELNAAFMKSEIVINALKALDHTWPQYLKEIAKKGKSRAYFTFDDIKTAMNNTDIDNDTVFVITNIWCKKNKLDLSITICDKIYDVYIEW